MLEIAVEVSDKGALAQLEQLGMEANGFSAERQGIDGVTLFTAVMTLGPLVIGGIVKVVQAQEAAKKHVRVLIDGVEIRGVSEATLLAILKNRGAKKSAK